MTEKYRVVLESGDTRIININGNPIEYLEKNKWIINTVDGKVTEAARSDAVIAFERVVG